MIWRSIDSIDWNVSLTVRPVQFCTASSGATWTGASRILPALFKSYVECCIGERIKCDAIAIKTNFHFCQPSNGSTIKTPGWIRTEEVLMCSRQCGILNISQPYRPPRPVTGILPYMHVASYHPEVCKSPDRQHINTSSVLIHPGVLIVEPLHGWQKWKLVFMPITSHLIRSPWQHST
jgi:hypothetical protein